MSISQNSNDKLKIEASPTKQLFIEMLVKDITLKDAIGDLVDNSIDAAKKISGSDDLSKFYVKINASSTEFSLIDNAGGIEAEVARSSAFCFGKPKDYVQGSHTIGQFGIGMKRAFFKIGGYIHVESIAETSSFQMHIDVPQWQELTKWDFKFDTLKEAQKNSLDSTRTTIKITNLNSDTIDKFKDGQFIDELTKEIAREHMYHISKGLLIEINGVVLKPKTITLTYDKELGIEPVFWKHTFKNGLNVSILAGVAEDSGVDGGWYIFCNQRLIVGPETTEITGWSGSGSKEMPKYHDQFFRFRGYTFFTADDSSKLPWNTTKTGMDLDSPSFIYVRNQMILLGKQVKKLMDDMKKERERGNPIESRRLSKAVEKAKVIPVNVVMSHSSDLPKIYKYPEELITVAPKAKKLGVKITFYKPDSVVEDVKEFFKVDDADSAGSLAFDRFYSMEVE